MTRTNIKEKTNKNGSEALAQAAIDSILEKKGKEVVQLNLSNLTEAVCDYFVICHGTSTTQVKAIADFVTYQLKHEFGEFPISFEGSQNAEWILIDYANIVVHVFLKDRREFYQLEDLWSDGIITNYSDEGDVII